MRVLEVFADVWCPFTHVGLRRLVTERDRRGRQDVVVRVRSWPLELVNGAPLASALAAEEIHALREVVAPELFRGFDEQTFPSTTLPALGLTALAYRRNDQTGERMSFALRTALFEEGRDVSDPRAARRDRPSRRSRPCATGRGRCRLRGLAGGTTSRGGRITHLLRGRSQLLLSGARHRACRRAASDQARLRGLHGVRGGRVQRGARLGTIAALTVGAVGARALAQQSTMSTRSRMLSVAR